MSWRIARSLDTLLAQVNAAWPGRDKSNDGTIGDERHQASHSEHNPDENGVVRARDITNDPHHGLDARKLAEALIASRDPRILYLISNREICSSVTHPWTWRPYGGSNPHEAHMHLSVVANPALYDNTSPWSISGTVAPPVVASSRFDTCLKPLLEHEGGNDDDIHDPGGRTSRGIIQSEYDAYRRHHGRAVRDVWAAADDEVRDIYRTEYWNVMRCDDLPPGVDYAVFDYGVNSGIARAAKELQRVVGTSQDGQIGPKTVAAARRTPISVINILSDERLAFLITLPTWKRYGRGWTTRVQDVRSLATKMAGDAGKAAPSTEKE